MTVQYADSTLEVAKRVNTDPALEELLRTFSDRISAVRPEQERFRGWCDRADLLYYAEVFTRGGSDLWWDDPSATQPGRSHVSVNLPSTYVDVPAALQAVEPIENMLATDNTEEARTAAAALERVYVAWKDDESYVLKFHKACTVKGLYGRTAAKVYWDREKKKPCIDIVEQPRNLWMGFRSDSYDEVEWAAYVTRMTPNAVMETYEDINVDVRDYQGASIPFVSLEGTMTREARSWLQFGVSKIEVWDYWYRKPVFSKGALQDGDVQRRPRRQSRCARPRRIPGVRWANPLHPALQLLPPRHAGRSRGPLRHRAPDP